MVRKIGEERREAETAREDARKKQEQVEGRKCTYVVEREEEEEGRRRRVYEARGRDVVWM